MKRYLLLLVLISFTIPVYCQQITFQKTFGGTDADFGTSIQQTTDGGYIISGHTRSYGAGNYDVYLIKTDINADIVWTKTFGGIYADYGYMVQQTTDGGYIIAGSSETFGSGSFDIYLVKTDVNGNFLWTKTFGGVNNDQGYSVRQTADGGYILIGITNSFGAGLTDVYLIKTNANGDSLWSKSIGETNVEHGYSVQQTTDGGYIIAGFTYSFGAGADDVYLIKITSNGNLLWSKTYGGSNFDWGYSIVQTTDGGYIITGGTMSFGAGNADVYLIKTDVNGDSLWTKTFGGPNDDEGKSVIQTTDDGYIISGYTQSFGAGTDDVYLIKTDSIGDTLWTRTFGGPDKDYGFSIQQTTDLGYIITQHTWNFGLGIDVYLIKTDSLGMSGCNEGSTTTIVTTPAMIVTSPATIVSSTATIVASTATVVGSGGTDTTLCITVGIQSAINNPKSGIAVSPNPFTSELAVQSSEKINQIIIYDLPGEIVYQKQLPSNNTSAALNLSFLQQGVYFLNVKSKGESWTKKIVKM